MPETGTSNLNVQDLIDSLTGEFEGKPQWVTKEVFRWQHKRWGWYKGRWAQGADKQPRLKAEQRLNAICNPSKRNIFSTLYHAHHTYLSLIPWIEGQTLSTCIREGNMNPRWLRDIERSLQLIHKQELVHSDIKPNNIVIAHQRAHLIDFSTAMPINRPFKSLPFRVASPSFSSPQQSQGQGNTSRQDDWYALAMTICASLQISPYNSLHSGESDKVNMSLIPTLLPSSYQMIMRQRLRALSNAT